MSIIISCFDYIIFVLKISVAYHDFHGASQILNPIDLETVLNYLEACLWVSKVFDIFVVVTADGTSKGELHSVWRMCNLKWA